MTSSLKLSFSVLIASVATLLSLSGCSAQPPKGATIQIQGPANDTVQWTALQSFNPPSCSCLPGSFTGACADGGVTSLPSPPISQVVDDSVVQAFSNAGPTPCMAAPTSIPECPNPTSPFTVACNPTNTAAAQGNVRITGTELKICDNSRDGGGITGGACGSTYPFGRTFCDSGGVSLTFDGQTVKATYGCSSTASKLGFQLAQAIVQNATLGSLFVSAANGPVAYVNAINTGTQYDYPWTSSATCSTTGPVYQFYGYCSFSVGLSPAASLASPSQPQ